MFCEWHHRTWWVSSHDVMGGIIKGNNFVLNWGFFGKFITYCLHLVWLLCHIMVFEMKGYTCASFQKFWKKNWKPKPNIPFWINLLLYFENTYFTHTKVKSWVVCANEFLGRNIMNVGNFRPFKDQKNWRFVERWGCVMSILWVFQCQFLVFVSIQSCHQHVVEGCAMSSTNGNTFEFLS